MAQAIVLLSGGIDSTVTLAIALDKGKTCLALSFDYGQRHILELEAAKAITSYYNVPHQIIKIDPHAFGKSSLVSNLKVPTDRSVKEMETNGIPNTYVPARNTLFLAFALAQCELHESQEIYFGPNAMDYACYPDCRPDYLQAFQRVMNTATQQAISGNPPQLITPLISLTKTEIIKKGRELKAPLDLTLSCYQPLNLKTACQHCDACVLRQQGFAQLDNRSL